MNKTLSTTLIVLAVLALAAVIFFAGSMYARINTFGPSMMNGYSGNKNNTYAPNTMMNGRGGNGMMNGDGFNTTNLTPLTVDQAKAAAQNYLANLKNSDLQVSEVMIFDKNAYVVVKETSTGTGAFELLVDPGSQIAYPEHGPNMMWNLKYSGLNHQYMIRGNGGMMSMMNGYSWESTNTADVSAKMTVTPEQAIEYAQKYLNTNVPGASAAIDPVQFYGYYTLDFEKDGQVAGMLSVNGYSGQVFLHTWHGTFIQEAEVE